MPLFRRSDPRPAPPSNDDILNTFAAVALMATEHDGAIELTPEQQIVLINAQAEAARRGLWS